MTVNVDEPPSLAARRLLRATRAGSLATSGPGGQPFVSLVTPAAAPDGSVLLLLSDMAEHTRHLRRNDPHCAVLVAGPPAEVNPQTAPRLTLTGLAKPEDDPALKARYLAIHPYAALYADFGDFRLWRVQPTGGLLVSGFGRAARLREADLSPDPAAVAGLLAEEPAIIAHCNQDHQDALARIAGETGSWRMVTVDADGCDLAFGERVLRIHWRAPVASAQDVRRELIRLANSREVS